MYLELVVQITKTNNSLLITSKKRIFDKNEFSLSKSFKLVGIDFNFILIVIHLRHQNKKNQH